MGGPRFQRAGKPESRQANSDQLAALFLLLADPCNAPLLDFISATPRTVPECTGLMEMAGANVRSKLSHLQQLGLIRQDGEFYMVADDRVAEFICLARSLAATNADALMQCRQLKRAPL
jgi:hypothetical protein